MKTKKPLVGKALQLAQFAEDLRPHGPRFSLEKVARLCLMSANASASGAVEGVQRSRAWKEQQKPRAVSRARERIRDNQPRRSAFLARKKAAAAAKKGQ